MAIKKAHQEQHMDETWLIPYADMLTLLLALFIVMFAISKVENGKFQKISDEFNVIFSSGKSILNDTDKTTSGKATPEQIAEAYIFDSKAVEEDTMQKIKAAIDEEILQQGYADRIKTSLNAEGLEISIQDVVLFKPNDANVLKDMNPLLIHISQMLSNLDNEIKVVGHTDNMPISTDKFRSNWDLSAMRAINVMNFMVDMGKLHPERFSIQGYGEYMPAADNSTAEGRAKNRRIEIFIIRKYRTAS